MFEQAELQGTQMGPNGPPNAKGTAKIAPEIANSKKNRAIWVILAILAKTVILVILASHFRDRVATPKKSPTWGFA